MSIKNSSTQPTDDDAERHSAVVGLQFGDEGKGQLVDLLSAEHAVIVRYNGGANAGHSMRVGNHKYVLHQLPVGTIRPETTNVIATGAVVSPDNLISEIDDLTSLTIGNRGKLFISERAHVVMPYHVAEDRLRARLAVKLLSEAETLGTTDRGIGPCYADKAQRDTAIRVGDLFDSESLERRLGYIVNLKNAQLSSLAEVASAEFSPYEVSTLLKTCEKWAQRLEEFVTNTEELMCSLMGEQSFLFEGANACLLDVDQGTYPFVTSSQTTVAGVPAGVGVPVIPGRRLGVAKAYMSRVGTGPFVTELPNGSQVDKIREIGQEYGSTTGRPRRIGWLDLPLLQHAVRTNGVNELVITGLAVLATLSEFRVCTNYVDVMDQGVVTLPTSASGFSSVKPRYVSFKPNGQPLSPKTALPEWVEDLVALVESVCPVSAICVGRTRDDVIWLDDE